MKDRQRPNYDSAWALWRFNDLVVSNGLDASQVRIARMFFLLGVDAALGQAVERTLAIRADAEKVLNR